MQGGGGGGSQLGLVLNVENPKIFHNNIFIFQPNRGLEKVFKKSAFLMFLLRKHKLMCKAIISLISSHSGGHLDILIFFEHQNSKKVMFFQNFEKFWGFHAKTVV